MSQHKKKSLAQQHRDALKYLAPPSAAEVRQRVCQVEQSALKRTNTAREKVKAEAEKIKAEVEAEKRAQYDRQMRRAWKLARELTDAKKKKGVARLFYLPSDVGGKALPLNSPEVRKWLANRYRDSYGEDLRADVLSACTKSQFVIGGIGSPETVPWHP